MKRTITLITALSALTAFAVPTASDTIAVTAAAVQGPFAIPAPYMSAAKDAAGKEFQPSALLDNAFSSAGKGTPTSLENYTVKGADMPQVGSITFRINSSGYAEVSVPVSGVDASAVRIDGEKISGAKALKAGAHTVEVVYLAKGDAEPKVSVVTSRPDLISVAADEGPRPITMHEIVDGRRFYNAALSPDGEMIYTQTSETMPGGTVQWTAKVISAATGNQIASTGTGMQWMPRTPLLYNTRREGNDRVLYTLDPRTGKENVVSRRLPEGGITVGPTEDFIVISTVTSGPKEGNVYQILEPEDRQPGWRDRRSVSVRDIATGVTRPLTFGNVNTWVTDLSTDGRTALVMSSRNRLEKRPTTVFNIMTVDIAAAKADTLVAADGFVGNAVFSPDGTKILITGSPEALGGIGKNVPEGRIPSMTDNQLFIMDIASRKIEPVTKNFNPSVTAAEWSHADGKIYLSAEDGDCIRIFSLDPATGKTAVAATGEDLMSKFSLPLKGSRMAWIGQGASNGDRLYVTDLKKKSTVMLDDAKADMLADVKLGKCEAWNFVNAKGDTIIGRYYLPADFDPAKKYPMIVNYYGGSSPSERTFESRYPHHVYAAQGYVVYVLNPSGATGRGQEFSSRHVNTAGQGVAEDIIEGTKKFCAGHPFVDDKKIGCIGASYGGFMTMYLQTVTDLFAAAISHAGISDHTSYWGEGYWGYSYSEVSMAESYPWADTDLYVKQSPLYNADKVHTPILFLHGDADHNVPVGESIQMFTALKLLGRPTAFVAVADQDHHILDYDKRLKWQDTIFGWFNRYLKDDPALWESMYPEKEL